MQRLKIHFLLVLIFSLISFSEARSEVFNVKMQLLNINVDLHRAVCDSENGSCFRTLIVPPKDGKGENEYIEVGIKFYPDFAYFQFMRGGEILHTSIDGRDYYPFPLSKFYQGKKTVELHLPGPGRMRKEYPNYPFKTVSVKIADLEIDVEPE